MSNGTINLFWNCGIIIAFSAKDVFVVVSKFKFNI